MTPNLSQQRAIESEKDTTVCLAGPGSGKTATLIERLQHRIDCGSNPAGFIVVTFTNAAADEIRARLAERSHLGDCLGYCGTLHGFCLRLLQRHGHLIGFGERITVLSEEQTEKLVTRAITELNYRGAVARVSEAIAKGPELHHLGARPTPAELVAARFFKQLRRSSLVTFDTLLHYALQLLIEHRHEVRGWNELYVDEYQDSSDLDQKIYDALPVQFRFLVGDCDQAVYTFRGGNVAHIIELANIHGPVLLEDNYRSVPEICDAADRLIQHNTARHPKHIRSTREAAGDATATAYADQRAEIRGIAQQITDCLDQGDCAVLLRTNHLVEEYRLGLEAHGIKVARKQAKQMPQDWAACKALLGLLNDPDNDLLAYWWLEAGEGQRNADKLKLAAATAGISIGRHIGINPEDLQVQDVPAMLAKAGISIESVTMVQQTIAGQEAATTLSELILALNEQQQPAEQVSSGVTVNTIHGAKGKEWDSVFLPAFEQETIPGGRRDVEIEEERRLAYVGMTRARNILAISYCQMREPRFCRGAVEVNPSQFIREAGL